MAKKIWTPDILGRTHVNGNRKINSIRINVSGDEEVARSHANEAKKQIRLMTEQAGRLNLPPSFMNTSSIRLADGSTIRVNTVNGMANVFINSPVRPIAEPTLGGCSVPIQNVVLMIDTSGSMGHLSPNTNKTRMDIVIEASIALINSLKSKGINFRVKLIEFKDDVQQIQGFAAPSVIIPFVNDLEDYGGDIYSNAMYALQDSPDTVVYFITDGANILYNSRINLGYDFYTEVTKQSLDHWDNVLAQGGIKKVFTIGVDLDWWRREVDIRYFRGRTRFYECSKETLNRLSYPQGQLLEFSGRDLLTLPEAITNMC